MKSQHSPRTPACWVNRHHTCHTSHVWYRLTRYPKVWLYASIITILAEWGCYDYVQGRRQALGAHPNEIRWGEFYSRSPAPHRADFDRINQATRHLVSCSKFYKLLHDEGLGILTPCLACCIVAIRLFNPIVGRKCDAGWDAFRDSVGSLTGFNFRFVTQRAIKDRVIQQAQRMIPSSHFL